MAWATSSSSSSFLFAFVSFPAFAVPRVFAVPCVFDFRGLVSVSIPLAVPATSVLVPRALPVLAFGSLALLVLAVTPVFLPLPLNTFPLHAFSLPFAIPFSLPFPFLVLLLCTFFLCLLLVGLSPGLEPLLLALSELLPFLLSVSQFCDLLTNSFVAVMSFSSHMTPKVMPFPTGTARIAHATYVAHVLAGKLSTIALLCAFEFLFHSKCLLHLRLAQG
mmetsp:Transcript_34195/g.76426  ORF Transcript_34195/g.76426 Transcript_34195/m.76426 type:complete len:219 (+) Transcript_34195:257-913(+)